MTCFYSPDTWKDFAEDLERLDKEIERLKELLKKQPQYDNFRGEGGDFNR
jgi:hypothetical protein